MLVFFRSSKAIAFGGGGGVNTHPQMQANYADRVTAGWTRAAAW